MKICFLLEKMIDGYRGQRYQCKPFPRCWDEIFLDLTGSLGRPWTGKFLERGDQPFLFLDGDRGTVGTLWRSLGT